MESFSVLLYLRVSQFTHTKNSFQELSIISLEIGRQQEQTLSLPAHQGYGS